MRKPFFTLVLFIASMSLLYVGGADGAADKITVGSSLSISGTFSGNCTYMANAMNLWLDKVNGEGGIYVKQHGKKLPVEWKYYDDRSDATTSQKLYERLITEDKVDFLLGPYSSTITKAVSTIAEKYKIPMIAPCAASPSVYNRGLDYLFHSGTMANVYLKASFKFFETLDPKVKTFAVTASKTAWALDSKKACIEEIKKREESLGWKVVVEEEYALEAVDLSAVIESMMKANPDVAIMCTYVPDAVLLTNQAADRGFKPMIFYPMGGSFTKEYRDGVGDLAEGVFAVADMAWNHEGKDTDWFLEKYESTFGHRPNPTYAGFTYMSMQIYKQAIEKAGTLDRKVIHEMLKNEKFKTIRSNEFYFGNMTMDGETYTNIYPEALGAVAQYQNGVPLFVYPVSETKLSYPSEYFKK